MTDKELSTEIKNCNEVLKNGGTILYPTDTVWGIGCDATNAAAVEKVFAIKNRHAAKSLIVLVSDDAMLNKCVKEVPAMAWDILEHVTKPTTIIYPNGINVAKNVLAEDGSIAIRMIKEPFCNKLIHQFNKPIVSTSANISGETPPASFNDVDDKIKNAVDYVVNYRQPEKKNIRASSIIKIGINGEIEIIRK